MKEIVLTFYKNTRSNSKSTIHSYAAYSREANGNRKWQFTKCMDFYDAVDRIAHSEYRYVTVAAHNYAAYFFNANDGSKWLHNSVDLPETRRYDLRKSGDLIEVIKMVYTYMVCFGSDFDYTYNPFTDSNVIYHIGKLA